MLNLLRPWQLPRPWVSIVPHLGPVDALQDYIAPKVIQRYGWRFVEGVLTRGAMPGWLYLPRAWLADWVLLEALPHAPAAPTVDGEAGYAACLDPALCEPVAAA